MKAWLNIEYDDGKEQMVSFNNARSVKIDETKEREITFTITYDPVDDE